VPDGNGGFLGIGSGGGGNNQVLDHNTWTWTTRTDPLPADAIVGIMYLQGQARLLCSNGQYAWDSQGSGTGWSQVNSIPTPDFKMVVFADSSMNSRAVFCVQGDGTTIAFDQVHQTWTTMSNPWPGNTTFAGTSNFAYMPGSGRCVTYGVDWGTWE